ncbi:trafficking protein particle complex subunit 14 [Polyodon spathula]|uniref:trafficking protein particle complex subunit 14 n=1 Tax=Polyodon spathula TaxID=7913 RepID=UPI001B7F0388|nr:trafficking protein particle complex subunit 14 [Polyodon spathula]
MESQCEYFMHFPAVPISELSDPARYRSLPRRSHLYLGETVRFLLVLRCRDRGGGNSHSSRAWRELAGSLSAVASVSPGGSGQQGGGDETGLEAEEEQPTPGRGDGKTRGFRECKPLLIHNSNGSSGKEPRKAPVQSPLDEPVVLSDEVIFPLTVSLDKLPVSTLKVKLTPPAVSTTLTVLPPPTVKCQQLTVSGKYLTVLKESLLPACSHQSGDVAMASFYKIDSVSSRLPSMLSALEEHNFLFQLQVNERPQEDAKEGLEVPLVAVIQWSTPKLPFPSCIYTHYRLPSIGVSRPRFVMMASCESPVSVRQRFLVRYTLLNNLQDFLAVRLVWTPENAVAGKLLSREESAPSEAGLSAVVCHTPLSSLGSCRKGSSLAFSVSFEILQAGLYELSQHMKLKLQFTASVSNPPPEARPLSRRSSPGSPAVRDLLERREASLGRSQSFSHQQPSRSHLTRTGSVMERRAITPPVSSPIGRPLYQPQEKAVLSLDKIAKRECKVLVVEPVK